jgi:hypothetical protein
MMNRRKNFQPAFLQERLISDICCGGGEVDSLEAYGRCLQPDDVHEADRSHTDGQALCANVRWEDFSNVRKLRPIEKEAVKRQEQHEHGDSGIKSVCVGRRYEVCDNGCLANQCGNTESNANGEELWSREVIHKKHGNTLGY